MLVRKYQGRSEEEAMAKAKAELGPDAIILHIKQLSEKADRSSLSSTKADRSSLSSTNGIFNLKSAAKVEVIVALDHDLNEFTQPKALGVGEASEPKTLRRGEPCEHKELPTMPILSTNHQSPREGVSQASHAITNHQNSPLAPAERFRAYAISSGLRQKTAEERTYSNIKEISEPRAASPSPLYEVGEGKGERSNGKAESQRMRPKAFGVGERSEQSEVERNEQIRYKRIKSEVPKPLGPAAHQLYQHLLSHEVQEEIAQRLSLSIQELLSGDSSLSLREAMNVCIEELIRTSGGLPVEGVVGQTHRTLAPNLSACNGHSRSNDAKPQAGAAQAGLNIAQKPAVVAFIGPTGVGKTTTIAKLAAHYHLRENQRISLITVDTYRIAAIEQLKTYATYIGIPLEVALTPQEMHQLVRKHKNCDLILIDTPGRSQKDSFRIQELKMILSAASPQEVHLLLNVTTQHRVLWDVVRGFKVFSPNRLLFTKLDESACFGHILNLSVALGEPVSYLTTGQDVPDDIQLATIERITEYLLREGDVL